MIADLSGGRLEGEKVLMRSALVLAIIGSVLAVMSTRAAEPVPALNSGAYCEITAIRIYSDASNQPCLDSEARAERLIRNLWADTPGSVRKMCVKHSELVAPSYQGLATCLSSMVGDMWLKGELKVVPR